MTQALHCPADLLVQRWAVAGVRAARVAGRSHAPGMAPGGDLFAVARHCAWARQVAQSQVRSHVCWCAARDQAPAQAPAGQSLGLSLAQVAAAHAVAPGRCLDCAPPGCSRSRSVMSRCHASNAPGLSCSARTDQDKAARRTN